MQSFVLGLLGCLGFLAAPAVLHADETLDLPLPQHFPAERIRFTSGENVEGHPRHALDLRDLRLLDLPYVQNGLRFKVSVFSSKEVPRKLPQDLEARVFEENFFPSTLEEQKLAVHLLEAMTLYNEVLNELDEQAKKRFAMLPPIYVLVDLSGEIAKALENGSLKSELLLVSQGAFGILLSRNLHDRQSYLLTLPDRAAVRQRLLRLEL